MLVPRYWASARIEGKNPKGRRRVVFRYGWSDESEAAAKIHAEERAAEAMRRISAGEIKVPWRDRADTYGTESVPIREEIVERFDNAVVTRNAYGALCLNMPDVFFADVDLPNPEPLANRNWVFGPLFLGCAMLGAVLWKPFPGMLAGAILGFVLAIVALVFIRKTERRRFEADAPRRRRGLADSLATRFRSADVRIRIYETPAGIRLAAEHASYAPVGSETSAFFESLRADSRFVRLCRLQRCFRARVSPKPWRCGFKALNKTDGGRVWPVDASKEPTRRAWIADYERAASGYAACRLLSIVGLAKSDPRLTAILDRHDRLAGACSDLPLA